MDQPNSSRNPYAYHDPKRQDQPYNMQGSSRPLPFPEADREYQRETAGLSGRNVKRHLRTSPSSQSQLQHAGMNLPMLSSPYPTYGMFAYHNALLLSRKPLTNMIDKAAKGKAKREFEELSSVARWLGSNGSTPTATSEADRQRGGDSAQNIRVSMHSPLRVPIASPEIEMDDNYNMNMGSGSTVDIKTKSANGNSMALAVPPVPEEPRYLFSLRTLLELISLLAAMIPMVVAPHWGAYQRGFFCNDPNLMYPFHEGTVKPWLLYLICLTLPFVTVLVGEMCHFHVSKTGYGNMEVKYRLWRKGPVIPPVVVSLSRIVVLFTYGFLITKSVTDIAKYTVGRLRPHFLDVCKPNMSMVIRDGGCDRYITEAHCSTVNSTDPKEQYRLRDSRLSFLSGHAAMAFYRNYLHERGILTNAVQRNKRFSMHFTDLDNFLLALRGTRSSSVGANFYHGPLHRMFFVIFYLESRLRWMDLRYCKAIIQFGLFLMAALTGLSRISDHKHHWTDVFAGATLGLIVCVVTVFSIGGFFNDSHYLRYKLVAMLQKLDWSHEEGGQFARLLGVSNGRDPRVLRSLKHFTRQHYPKSA